MDNILDTQTVQRILKLFEDIFDVNDIEVQMHEYQGVWFADSLVQRDRLDMMPKWEARTEDVFVVTYPKSGTTWAQEIMYLALNGAKTERADKGHTFLRIPHIELSFKGKRDRKQSKTKVQWFFKPLKILILLLCVLKIMFQMLLHNVKTKGTFNCSIPSLNEMISMMPSPRLLKSHLAEHLLPPDIFKKKAKIVYVARNPKDLAVSYYHFHRYTPVMPKYDSWDTFIDDFMAGKVSWGKWYEHNIGYWKRRHEDNILFLKYEDMKKDERAAVKQICEFLGYHYSDDILDRITEHTTFKSMKKSSMTNPDSLIVRRGEDADLSFMRKGEVGDWKNYFTDAQNEAFNALYEEKLAGTGLEFEFE